MLRLHNVSVRAAKSKEAQRSFEDRLTSLRACRAIRDIKEVVDKADKELYEISKMKVPYSEKVGKRLELADSILENVGEMRALRGAQGGSTRKRKVAQMENNLVC